MDNNKSALCVGSSSLPTLYRGGVILGMNVSCFKMWCGARCSVCHRAAD
jgi:hypothetical protein